MIATLATETQKNVHISPPPSSGVTSGPGVELPGVGVYGLRYVPAGSLTSAPEGTEPGAILNASVRPANYAANQGSRAAGPVGLSTSRWRFAPGSPGAYESRWASW